MVQVNQVNKFRRRILGVVRQSAPKKAVDSVQILALKELTLCYHIFVFVCLLVCLNIEAKYILLQL